MTLLPSSSDSTITDELIRLQGDLKDLVGTFEYAYAMGHCCTIGDHPQFRDTRRYAADLRARIAELTE
jgi:hypothetical protein